MRSTIFGLAAACGAMAFAQGARAQELPQALERCRAVTSDLQRLSCYDSLVKGPLKTAGADAPQPPGGNVPSAPAPQPAPVLADGGGTGRWLHRQSRDGLDNALTEAVLLPATSANVGMIGRPGVKEPPMLVVRCKHNQAAIYVAFDLAVTTSDPKVPVQFRIDQVGPISAVWGRAENDQGFGLWNNVAAVDMIKKLGGGRDFFVRATPPNKGTSEAQFDLTGMDNALAPLRAACGW